MSHWNHRVIKKVFDNGDEQYSLQEVFYNKDGEILYYTLDPVDLACETIEDLKEYIGWCLKSLESPVLEEGKIVLAKEDDEYQYEEESKDYVFDDDVDDYIVDDKVKDFICGALDDVWITEDPQPFDDKNWNTNQLPMPDDFDFHIPVHIPFVGDSDHEKDDRIL
jgi:hypothetical protein